MGESISGPVTKQKESRTKRVSTGSVSGQSGEDVVVTWDVPFSDNNYTVTSDVLFDEAGDALRSVRVRSKTETGCVVHVWNAGLTSRTGELQVIAIGD